MPEKIVKLKVKPKQLTLCVNGYKLSKDGKCVKAKNHAIVLVQRRSKSTKKPKVPSFKDFLKLRRSY